MRDSAIFDKDIVESGSSPAMRLESDASSSLGCNIGAQLAANVVNVQPHQMDVVRGSRGNNEHAPVQSRSPRVSDLEIVDVPIFLASQRHRGGHHLHPVNARLGYGTELVKRDYVCGSATAARVQCTC